MDDKAILLNEIVRVFFPNHLGTKPAKKYQPKKLVWNGKKLTNK